MVINLRTLSIENLNLKNIDHYRLIKNNEEDFSTKKYISKRLVNFVSEPGLNSGFELGKTYIINDSDKLVGFFGTTEMSRDGIIELWCNIDSNNRGKNYGEKFLVQITSYLIEVVKGLNDIKLVINKCNYASRKVAVKSGYLLTDTSTDREEYRYFGK